MSVVVDASVWVSAADATDCFCSTSRAFLRAAAEARESLELPAIAHLEVACALTRRLRDADAGRALAEGLLRSPQIETIGIDAVVLREALEVGTTRFLRAGDALYVAVARRGSHELVSWDAELVDRGGAVTPESWLASHA